MIKVRNLGRKSLNEVIHKLSEYGLSLKDSDNPKDAEVLEDTEEVEEPSYKNGGSNQKIRDSFLSYKQSDSIN